MTLPTTLRTARCPQCQAEVGAGLEACPHCGGSLLGRVAEEETREIARTKETFRAPGLSVALFRPPDQVVAVVLQRFEGPPAVRPLSFHLEQDGQRTCGHSGGAPQLWKRLDQAVEGVTGAERQWWAWISRHRLDADLWAGAIPMRFRDCAVPASAELVLEDGDPEESRAWLSTEDPRHRRAASGDDRSATVQP